MSNVIDQIEAEQLKSNVPELRPGDTVEVHCKIVEGNRERIQVYEGVVIKIKGGLVDNVKVNLQPLHASELVW